MLSCLTPPPPAPPLPEEQIASSYRRYRWQVFTGIFLGYAAYYLVRKNFTLAGPYLTELGFTKTELGFAMSGVALAYGISKFVMGTVSDRSNARNFLSIGLVITSLLMILAGVFARTEYLGSWAQAGVTIPGVTLADFGSRYIGWQEFSVRSILLIWFGIQFLIGWFSACGWPPCGRVMTHWFSLKERGRTIAFWNVAHNVGGGLIAPLTALGVMVFGAAHWEYGIFYLPALISIGFAVLVWFFIRDTPQSCGLPPIEKFKNDYPPEYSEKSEQELSVREIVFKYVLSNRVLWYVGVANAFIYMLRYGVLDWAPTYLNEVKGYDIHDIGSAYFLYEFAAIPGTLLCGLLSDFLFRGRHALTAIFFMALTLVFVLVYWFNPAGHKWIDFTALLAIGFLIYGPVMLTGVLALEIAPKKASGTSAGFMSFWGYFIGTAFLAQFLMGVIVDSYGWNGGFTALCVGGLLSILFMIFAAVAEERLRRKALQEKAAELES